MKRYIVSYNEERGDRLILHFECLAEDADHASEQCENAYPGCVIRLAIDVEVR